MSSRFCFAPQFTPNLDEQAAVSDVLASWRPAAADLERLTAELCAAKADAVFVLSDSSRVTLPLHEVMISRFVRLLRLDQAPAFELAARLQDALPTELCNIALALMRQRGFTPERNAWLAAFLCHLARQPLTRSVVVSAAEFISGQTAFDTPSLLSAAEEQVRAAKGSADFVSAGRIYWSPDVAQHHQYRGEGRVDKALVKQKLEELAALETISAALFSFGAVR